MQDFDSINFRDEIVSDLEDAIVAAMPYGVEDFGDVDTLVSDVMAYLPDIESFDKTSEGADEWLDTAIEDFDCETLKDNARIEGEVFLYDDDAIEFYNENESECEDAIRSMYGDLSSFVAGEESLRTCMVAAANLGAKLMWENAVDDAVDECLEFLSGRFIR